MVNQYGRPRKQGGAFPETIEGRLSKFRDGEYYSSKEYNLEDIEVPILSVANWV
jgi:hypothetical protein